MFCCLCIAICGAGQQHLCDDNGHKTKTYAIVAKYFEKQLQQMETVEKRQCSRVICDYCWQRIQDFHIWQEEVFELQERYAHMSQLQFEQIVKLEVESCTSATQMQTSPNILEEDEKKVIPIVETEIELPIDDSNLLYPLADDTLGGSYNNIDNCDNITNASSNFGDTFSADKNAINDEDDKPLLLRIRAQKKPRKKIKKAKWKAAAATSAQSDKTEIKQESDAKQQERKRQSKTQEYDEFIAKYWKQELNCDLCGQQCTNFSTLRTHFRQAHDNDNGYVLCCDHKYYQRFHLVEHLRLHMDPEYFKCPECGKCSGNKRNLMTHIKTMHSDKSQERPFECEICHKTFAKRPILRSHMETHATGSKDHVCAHCGKGFVLKSRLDVHVRNVHSTTYHCVCEQCGRSFRARHALKRHLLDHDGGKRKWPCDQCNAQLYSKFSLGRHKRLAHHDRSTVYVCKECGKVSLTQDALRSHKKYVHETQRTFKCNLCDKAFKSAIVLKEHTTTHTGQDLYQCPHCPKMFKVSSNMHHHRKRAHPKEWAENRRNKSFASIADLSPVVNEVVL